MAQAQITRETFGVLPTGEAVDLYTLVTASGASAQITNYGGIVIALSVPDSAGVFDNVVLGHAHLDAYVSGKAYFGALVGRYANRIAHARFALQGIEYHLAANDGAHHLHGGKRGFNKVLWRAAGALGPDGPALELRYVSDDGEEGYPGALDVLVTY